MDGQKSFIFQYVDVSTIVFGTLPPAPSIDSFIIYRLRYICSGSVGMINETQFNV